MTPEERSFLNQSIYYPPEDPSACVNEPGPRTRLQVLCAISTELNRAYDKHGRDQWGRHEFYGILKEEFRELESAIFSDEPQPRVREEAIQIAAMVFRYLETADRYREPRQLPA